MAAVDEIFSIIIFYILLPVILFYLVAYYIFGIRKAKVEAFICNLTCGRLHKKFCDKEKKLLFEHMGDLRKNINEYLNVLEIGVGSGMNFKFYPRGTQVTALDLNPHHEYYMNKNLKNAGNHVSLDGFIQAFAENMTDIEDNKYDAVVCTLTLCTVRNPDAVLREVKRVLKPAGTFFYLEHVAAQRGSFLRRAQDKLQIIWPHLTGGCHINRETWTNLDKSAFSQVQYRHYSANMCFGLVKMPALCGTAVK